MAQGARACAGDLAGLAVKEAFPVVILMHCFRAQCDCVHLLPAVPAFPFAVVMVAFEQEECAAMDSRWDQAPYCSWVLAVEVVYTEAVTRETAVADAAEGRIHPGLGTSQVLLSVGDNYHRWDLGCRPAVLEVAAD
jgi:hypothetical protein